MCGVEKVGEEETDELERHGNHTVPDKGEDGADGKTFDVDFVWVAEPGRENRIVPVRRSCVCCCLFVCLIKSVSLRLS